MTTTDVGIVLIWLICGIYVYGWVFAYFQHEWPIIAEDNYWVDFCGFLAGNLRLSTLLVCY